MGICGSRTGNIGEDFIFNIITSMKFKDLSMKQLSQFIESEFHLEGNNMTIDKAISFADHHLIEKDSENHYFEYHRKIIHSLLYSAFELHKGTDKISSFHFYLLFGGFLKVTFGDSDEDTFKIRVSNFQLAVQSYSPMIKNVTFEYFKKTISMYLNLITKFLTQVIYEVGVAQKVSEEVLLEIKKLNENIFNDNNQTYYLDSILSEFKNKHNENLNNTVIAEEQMMEIFQNNRTFLYVDELRQQMISKFSQKS